MYRYFIQPQLNKANQSLIGYELLMKQHTSRMQTADTIPARAPEDTPALVKKIGKTTYKVQFCSLYFS